MFLAIDVGNTNIVVGVIDGISKEILGQFRVSTHPVGTADELELRFDSMLKFKGFAWSSVEYAIISSVVPQVTELLQKVFLKMRHHIVSVENKTPFDFKILPDTLLTNPRAPLQVGADRLVNAQAVIKIFGKSAAIVVDSGTATTICALSEKGEYLGGAIMPGIELSIQALAKSAAKLFTIDLVTPKTAIGTNTTDALRSGILFGYASMLDGMIKRFKSELGVTKCPVVATGGVSELLKGLATELTHFEPNLTLKGLVAIYESLSEQN